MLINNKWLFLRLAMAIPLNRCLRNCTQLTRLSLKAHGQKAFFGIRRLKRKKFGANGSHEWVDATSMAV